MKVEWKSCFRIGIVAFLLYLCTQYWKTASGMLMAVVSAATPLLAGCIMAYILNILMSFYEKHYFTKNKNGIVIKSRRMVCMVAAMITLVAAVVLVTRLVIPELFSCVKLLFSAVPEQMNKFTAWLDTLKILPENMEESLSVVDWEMRMQQIVHVFVSGVGNLTDALVGIVSSVISWTVTFFVGVVFSIYLLSDKEHLSRQVNCLMRHYLKEGIYNRIKYVLSVLNDSFHRYIVGQCTEAVILGMLCAAGMLLLRLPYATMIGALIAFTALIPIAGAYIGAGVGAFMIFTVSPVKAIIFLIFIVVLQQVEGNLIYPRVVGSSMGLPAIWVLAAITIGGGIMGIAGMLLSVPIAASLYRMIREDVLQTNLIEAVMDDAETEAGTGIKTDTKTDAKQG